MLPQEDQVLWRTHLNRTQFHIWRSPYVRGRQKKQRFTSKRVLLGLKEPMMIYQPIVMRRVAKIPGIKILILIREPVAMVESWLNHGCFWETPFGDRLDLKAALHSWNVFKHVVMEGFDLGRVLMIPTEALEKDPFFAYKQIFNFLGVSELPSDHTFGLKLHSRLIREGCALRKGCFSSCNRRSLRDSLRNCFRADSQTMQQMMEDAGWPSDLARMEPKPCLTLLEQSSKDLTGICGKQTQHLIPPDCFEDPDACQLCCEQMKQCSRTYWKNCCFAAWKEMLRIGTLEVRREICGNGPHHRDGCCLTAGSAVIFETP
eukprot:gnl/MRDRNA2_/MRDRNA2_210557_c0_seq1.p1 gnl/MRDRNA2_/MRDRNA2_210557_c0~~gnl/MRDRNA2_/MRDRNA2_210557_c0_seq1.p1  ORF type:complete len:334 (-),score=32.72 gnl/MRDRNA2_/MRDRNA2_210557_c0_seq1:35-985(-)